MLFWSSKVQNHFFAIILLDLLFCFIKKSIDTSLTCIYQVSRSRKGEQNCKTSSLLRWSRLILFMITRKCHNYDKHSAHAIMSVIDDTSGVKISTLSRYGYGTLALIVFYFSIASCARCSRTCALTGRTEWARWWSVAVCSWHSCFPWVIMR